MKQPPTLNPDNFIQGDSFPPPVAGVDRLGRYQLRRELGRGFSSVVFEAQDLQRQRTVALKVLTFLQNLSPERREDLSERFAREARAISALSHPGIVAIYEVGHADDGREFIAMELLPGESLRARLQREGVLPPEEAVPIALQVADALQYAHERGIVHRDVKPDNVFVLPDGRVKLMDFGVAHVLSDEALTQTGTVVGSPAYMSPEQINGEHLDGRSDVFSLGVMLAEMVVGHKPFEAPTIPAVMHRILNRPPQMESVSPRALRKIIEKALSKNRQTRFQSATAFSDALRLQVLPELPSWEPTSTAVMPVPASLALARHKAGSGGMMPDAPRRSPSRAAWWGLTAAGAALAAALSLAFFHPSAHLADRSSLPPIQTVRPVSGTVGIVRQIPAYWGRRPTAPSSPATRHPWVVSQAELSHPPSAAQPAAMMRITENKAAVPSKTPVSSSPPPAVPAAPHRAVHAYAPQLAVAAHPSTAPSTPQANPLVVKVGGFRQEQTLTPPTIVVPRSAPPTDQDQEQISALDTAPNPPNADGVPDSAPRLLHRTPLLYPRDVPDSALGGTVTLRVFVDEDGNVSHIVVAHSSGLSELDKAAVLTVKDWEYEPAFHAGQTVPGATTERVTFTP